MPISYRLTALPGGDSCVRTVCLQGLILLSVLLVVISPALRAEEVEFNVAFLPQDSKTLDLSLYQKGNPVFSGVYRADIVINGELSNRQDIRIVAKPDGSQAVVCFDPRLVELVGVDLKRLEPESLASLNAKPCAALSDWVSGSTATFLPSSQELDLSIPQISMRRSPRGYVSPQLWDAGVTAGSLAYSFTGSHNTNSYKTYVDDDSYNPYTTQGAYPRKKTVDTTTDTAYLGLQAGLNLGEWRLRHNGSLSWQTEQGSDYQSINTYAQHDVSWLQSQLTLGQTRTDGDLFESVLFQGVQLSTDDRMLPDSQRNYAPTIRGVARTNARVVIRQAGNLLYETTVAPGPFLIDDLYSAGYGGDLAVTVYEADGSQQNFVVPYAAVSRLLRPGTSRFGMVAGQTRLNYVSTQARFVQGTYQYGLSNMFTAYGGGQASEHYRSVLGGLVMGTTFGAFGLDLTQAQAELEAGRQSGQSLRLTYSKNFQSTGSNLSVVAARFSTSGYLDLSDAVQTRDAEERGYLSRYGVYGRERSRFTATIDQTLGGYGQLSLSGVVQNYWENMPSQVNYQFSYSKQFNRVSANLNITRSRNEVGEMDNTLALTLSMPLDFGSTDYSPQLSTTLGRDTQGNYSENANLSGVAGENRQYTYGVTASHDGAYGTSNMGVNGQYVGPRTTVSGSVSHGNNYDNLNLGLNGTIVAHPGGVTFTPYTGETMAVLSAPGAQGAQVLGYPGMVLDERGYAVIPYLQPYILNTVTIDPVGMSQNVELAETSQQTAPRAGAVVMLKYGTQSGQAWVLNVHLNNGEPLPFGAGVNDAAGNSVGMVGQGGQLYARVSEGTRQLWVSWGSQADQQCTVALPPNNGDEHALRQMDAACVQGRPDPELVVSLGQKARP